MEKKGFTIDIEEYEDKERLSLTLMAIGMIMGAMIVIISAILAFGAFVAEGDYGYAIKSVSFLPIPICIFLIGYFRIKRMGRELSASAFEKKNEKEWKEFEKTVSEDCKKEGSEHVGGGCKC